MKTNFPVVPRASSAAPKNRKVLFCCCCFVFCVYVCVCVLKLLPPIPFKYHAVVPVIILIFRVTDVFSFEFGINLLNSKEIAANNSIPEENEMFIASRAWHKKKI